MTKGLAKIEEQLKTEKRPNVRTQLEERKAKMEARLSAKQAMAQQQKNKGAEPTGEKVEFPLLTKRLANIEAKLETAKQPAVIALLQKRKPHIRPSNGQPGHIF